MANFRIVVVWHPDVEIPFSLKHNRKIFKIQNNIYYKEVSMLFSVSYWSSSHSSLVETGRGDY